MKSKLYILSFAISLLFLLSFVSAQGTLGGIKLGQSINITQGCSGSTYANISYITLNGKIINNTEISMVKSGVGYSYPYTPGLQGYYTVLTHCNENGVDITAPLDFTVSASGGIGSANITLFVIIILIIYGIAFFGFFGKNQTVALLGGMAMLALGLYTINNGIIIYKDFITNIFSWTTIGIGATFVVISGIEFIQDSYN